MLLRITLSVFAFLALGFVGAGVRTTEAAEQIDNVLFDVIVVSAPGTELPDGTPASGYVNGLPCGTGWVDASAPGLTSVLLAVPKTCAYPGAKVHLVVGGYLLKEAGAWGIGYSSVSNGWAYTPINPAHFSTLPPGRWGGTLVAPPGLTIVAKVGAETCGVAVSTAPAVRGRAVTSNYEIKVLPASLPPVGHTNCGIPGVPVTFWVNGVQAQQAPAWSPGLHQMTLSLP